MSPRRPATAQASTGGSSTAPAKPVLDEAEAKRLTDIADKDPSNATPRTQLGNLYFDAERYDEPSSGTKRRSRSTRPT